MDSDKYIPLDLFLDFGRIKPICSTLDMLAQAVEGEHYFLCFYLKSSFFFPIK